MKEIAIKSEKIKNEDNTSAKNHMLAESIQLQLRQHGGAHLFTHHISQKDFLFDPLAAAYYERFSTFIPFKTPLILKDLKWPALKNSQEYSRVNRVYRTFYQEYCL